MIDALRRLLQHDTWANRKVLESLKSLPERNERCEALLAHIASSKRMWLGRINKDADANINTWPSLTLEDSTELLSRMEKLWSELLEGTSEDGLHNVYHYMTAAGEPGQQRLEDILFHYVLHSQYHRAQIATAVREAGGTPASTDFVVMAREERLAAGAAG
ncbi:DinB family protein [bacterium]|nr:DinB family protein [bacterium]